MTDEHTKGAISKATGKVEEGLGKLTGNKEQEPPRQRPSEVQGAGQGDPGRHPEMPSGAEADKRTRTRCKA